MIKTIIVVSLIAGILIISSPASAAGADVLVKVVPASIDASVGDEFTIEIIVDPGGADVYGVQYDLVFDPSVLQVVNQSRGDFLSQDGANTIEIVNKFNNTLGKLEYGETRMGAEGGVTAPGTLARITFRVVGDHGSNLKLEDVIVSNPEAQPLDISVESGVCLVGGKTPGATPTATQTGGTSTPAPTVTATPPATSTTPEKTGTQVSTPASTEEPGSTPAATATPDTPGFGAVIAGIMILAYAFKRRV